MVPVDASAPMVLAQISEGTRRVRRGFTRRAFTKKVMRTMAREPRRILVMGWKKIREKVLLLFMLQRKITTLRAKTFFNQAG